MFRFSVTLFLLLAITMFPAAAQVDRATLVGTVTDTTGAVTPGAKVEVVAPDTGLRRQSDGSTYAGTAWPSAAWKRRSGTGKPA